MQKINKLITKINEWIAVNLTLAMSTMWMVYAFFAIAVMPFFFPEYKDLIQYISGSIIQLASLPLIMVGTNILSRAANIRAEQDHHTLMEQHLELHEQIGILRRHMEVEKNQNEAIKELSKKIDRDVNNWRAE